jgi:hypothetical protein
MGEIADQLLNGDDCEGCGMPFETPGDGFPRMCAGCLREEVMQKKRRSGAAIRGALVLVLAATVCRASEVQWTRFRGKVKAVNYKTSTLTLDSGGDLVTVKLDDDVMILEGKEAVQPSGVLIDDKVTLIYAPKAAAPKDPDAPPPGGVYQPVRH